VYRTPGRYVPERSVRIHINDDDNPAAVLSMSEKWASSTLQIDKGSLVKGVNKLKIVWPYTSMALDTGDVPINNNYLQATFPVLGEVFSLTAVAGEMERTAGFLKAGSSLVREIS
jgi:hypothetical protein